VLVLVMLLLLLLLAKRLPPWFKVQGQGVSWLRGEGAPGSLGLTHHPALKL
jgi:hypothetical protein